MTRIGCKSPKALSLSQRPSLMAPVNQSQRPLKQLQNTEPQVCHPFPEIVHATCHASKNSCCQSISNLPQCACFLEVKRTQDVETFASTAGGAQSSEARAGHAEAEAQQGPYLYAPSEARSAHVIGRAGSPARSDSTAFSRQAFQSHMPARDMGRTSQRATAISLAIHT